MFEARYERVKLLGEGSFGAAYLVRDRVQANCVQVAKEIRLRQLTEQQRRAACAEADVLRMMSHSNIVAYVATFLEGPTLHILMEYADGGDLAGKIKERKDVERSFREREVMFIFVQLALALAHVHGHNILHRDLKPLNVFLTSDGVVKLGDFGIARVLESASIGAQTVIGTPHYLSPEICNNEPYGVKSDLWSLGVVLYELAALFVPFHAVSLPAIVMKICGLSPEPLPESYSKGLNGIVFGLLEKEPPNRPGLDLLLRSAFVQQHVEDLLSHSIRSHSGGCEDLLSGSESTSHHRQCSSVDGVAVGGSELFSSAPREEDDQMSRQVPETTQLPRSLEKRQDEAREEFFRNRDAAHQAKRRAQSGSVIIGVRQAEPPANVLQHEQHEDKRQRVVEVRQRSEDERAQRDAARKQELEQAMREARQDRKALEERRLAREANSINGSWPAVLSQENAPEPKPVVKEKEAGVLQDLQQELSREAKDRKALRERNDAACFSPPFKPPVHFSEPKPITNGEKQKPWVLEIPFHDNSQAMPQTESTRCLGLDVTIKPSDDITIKPSLKCSVQDWCSSNQADLCRDAIMDTDDSLHGSSRLVPIITASGQISPPFSASAVGQLQVVLANALHENPATEPSSSPHVGNTRSRQSELGESAPLEYSLSSTEVSATLRSLQEVLEACPQAATAYPSSHPLPTIVDSSPAAAVPAVPEEAAEPAGAEQVSSSSGFASGSSRQRPADLAISLDTSPPSLSHDLASPAPSPPALDPVSSPCNGSAGDEAKRDSHIFPRAPSPEADSAFADCIVSHPRLPAADVALQTVVNTADQQREEASPLQAAQVAMAHVSIAEGLPMEDELPLAPASPLVGRKKCGMKACCVLM